MAVPCEDLAAPERQYFPNDLPAIPATMISIRVNPGGRLIAQGTEVAPIIFTSDSATPRVNDWQGFECDGRVVARKRARRIRLLGNPVRANAGPNISHSTFQHIAACAICPGFEHRPPNELVISGNTFRDAGMKALILTVVRISLSGAIASSTCCGCYRHDGSTIRMEGNSLRATRRPSASTMAGIQPSLATR